MFFHCTENVYQAFVVWLFQQKRVRQINSHHFTSLLYHIWGGCESKPNHTRAVRVCYGVCVPIRNIYTVHFRCVFIVIYTFREAISTQHIVDAEKKTIHIYFRFIIIIRHHFTDPERIFFAHIPKRPASSRRTMCPSNR